MHMSICLSLSTSLWCVLGHFMSPPQLLCVSICPWVLQEHVHLCLSVQSMAVHASIHMYKHLCPMVKCICLSTCRVCNPHMSVCVFGRAGVCICQPICPLVSVGICWRVSVCLVGLAS